MSRMYSKTSREPIVNALVVVILLGAGTSLIWALRRSYPRTGPTTIPDSGVRMTPRSGLDIAAGLTLTFLTLLSACSGAAEDESTEEQISVATSPTSAPRVPFAFVENRGQWGDDASFVATLGGVRVVVGQQGFDLRGSADELPIVLRFPGAKEGVEIRGEEPLQGKFNYFLGSDSDHWRTAVRAYESVRYLGLYPGVDLRLRKSDGRLEYDLLLERGARLDGIELRCEGARSLSVDPTGALVVAFEGGEIQHLPPISWEETSSGSPRPVRVSYRILSRNSFGFVADDRDENNPMVIDPGLDWASYLGGSAYEFAYAVAYEPSGAVTVVGETASAEFPVSPGSFDPTYNGVGAPTIDVFVTRMDPNGSMVYSTYLGGSTGDKPYDLATDGSGAVTVTGNTTSSNFPTTTGAYDRTLGGGSDAFVTRLSADGSSLLYSTLLGGSDGDVANGIDLDQQGNAIVAGVTSSGNFPVTPGALQSSASGSSDAFVAKLNSSGTGLLYSTFLGGSSGDVGKDVAVGGSGQITVVGVTSSSDFPTSPSAFDGTPSGTSDAFVTRLNASLSDIVYSTLLGGSKGDVAEALVLEGSGAAIVAGVTSSTDFPKTPDAYGSNLQGSSDTFVTKVALDGASLVYSVLIGGTKGDVGKGVALDQSGAVLVGGQTSSGDFPTTPGAFDNTAGGSADGFLLQLSADGGELLYSSYVGGSRSDGGEGLAAMGEATAMLVGVTNSSDFPATPGAIGTSISGNSDGFAAQLEVRVCGVDVYGTSTPACSDAIEADAVLCPEAGDPEFAVVCTNAPPLAVGAMVLGLGKDETGTPIAGITAYIDLEAPLITVSQGSDASGVSVAQIPLTLVGPGVNFCVQFVWLNTDSCGGLDTLSASNALALTVQ